MQYMVVTGDTAGELVRRVNEHLAQGWKLQGGVSVGKGMDQGYDREVYAQALIKE